VELPAAWVNDFSWNRAPGTIAFPVASLIMQKYILRKLTVKEKIKDAILRSVDFMGEKLNAE
jgi:hypothetical protein